jgi:hypothetical protein
VSKIRYYSVLCYEYESIRELFAIREIRELRIIDPWFVGCREQVLVQGAGSRCRCMIRRAELTADQLQQGQGQGIQGENTPAMLALAHEFREVESRSPAPSTVDR